jgi:C1A family cysteine protease
VAIGVTAKYNAEALATFNSWQLLHGKVYTTPKAFDHAMRNFQASVARVAANNARLGPESTFQYGVTKFADLTPAEFKARYLNRKPAPMAHKKIGQMHECQGNQTAVPTHFDWRTQSPNPITKVKDQGQCGSCWAFSVTEEIESMHILKGHPAINLAPEQIVDCDTTDAGCNGGDTPTAYQYVVKAGGMELETSYPYTAGKSGHGGTCKFTSHNIQAKITGFSWVIPECSGSCGSQNMDTVKQELSTVGPFSICVNAEPWQDYNGGVFNDASCGHAYSDLDHCVQLVGYTPDYWLVRNSWAEDWGEKGYIYVSTSVSKGNLCGIMDEVTYANAV